MATNPDDQLALLRRLREQNKSLSIQVQALKGGDGGGTFDAMVPLKDYVDKADEAVETRLTAKLDKLATKGTVWGAVATVLGILLAVLALATSRFDSGMSVGSSLEPVLSAQHQRDDVQDRKLDLILSRLPAAAVKSSTDGTATTTERATSLR